MQTHIDHSHIKGWGSDLDHANRPAYPKERTPPRLEGVHWQHPDQQLPSIEVFHSTERPELTPVFGTAAPPSGLSGKLRRFAFRFSENDIRHWLMLLLADRINMIEGLGSDLRRGRIPNVFAEMGARSEFRYNRKGAVRKAAIGAALVGVGIYLLRRRK
jgi:hypothetical protein